MGSYYEVPIHSYTHIPCMTSCVWFLYCGVSIATQITVTMCGHSMVWRNVGAYYGHMLGPYTEYRVWGPHIYMHMSHAQHATLWTCSVGSPYLHIVWHSRLIPTRPSSGTEVTGCSRLPVKSVPDKDGENAVWTTRD